VGDFVRQGDFYVGVLPDDAFIATGLILVGFEGQVWPMMSWAFREYLYDTKEAEWDVVQVMVHEAFHWWQPQLFCGPESSYLEIDFELSHSDHMDDLFGRVSVQLEINALIAALRSTDEEARLAAIQDALSIRAERRNRYPEAAVHENIVEVSEGTATYTDLRLVKCAIDLILDWIEWHVMTRISGSTGLSHGFGYVTGALYALLLDEISADWKEKVQWNSGMATDFGGLLQVAAGITELTPFDELDLEQYGYSEIVAVETAWVENHARMVQEAFETFQDVPMLLISDLGELSLGGDIEVFSIPSLAPFEGGLGTVFYGDFEYFGPFGRLTLRQGHLLLDSPHQIPAPHIAIDGSRASCHNWMLELNDGFLIEEVDGNFRVVRAQ
jgi:hypothetical protein